MEVGLEEDVERSTATTAAGLAREALEEGATKLAEELRMSLDYYGAQDGVTPVDASSLRPRQHDPRAARADPGRPRPSTRVELRRRSRTSIHEDAARLTVSYGLALEE